MRHAVPAAYRVPLWTGIDPVTKRSFATSGSLGLLVLAVVVLCPTVERELQVEDVPERFARLILAPPARPVPVTAAPSASTAAEAAPAEEPAPEVAPPTAAPIAPARRRPEPVVPENTGQEGREKAEREVTAAMQETAKSLDKTLQDLSASLGKRQEGPKVAAVARKGAVPVARRGSDVTSVAASAAGSGVSADMGASVVAGAPIRLESAEPGGAGTSPGGRRRGGAASGTSGRTDASLLAVVERYAAGIRFCYDNELKKDPGLRGKLVVSITVAASGEVSEARVVENSVGSAALCACVLAKIESWTFPQVPAGSTVFQAPFVFTPPRE